MKIFKEKDQNKQGQKEENKLEIQTSKLTIGKQIILLQRNANLNSAFNTSSMEESNYYRLDFFNEKIHPFPFPAWCIQFSYFFTFQ